MNISNTMNMKVTIDHNNKGHSQCKLLLPGKVQVDVWTIPKHLKVYPAGRGHALSNNFLDPIGSLVSTLLVSGWVGCHTFSNFKKCKSVRV